MRSIPPYALIALVVTSLSLMMGTRSGAFQAQTAASPTPTYDPREYDLGRNWYWHHCMPCHGDVGQGLTDDWRAVWVPDHQDCWSRGCHGGKRDDEGFPIPTFVPAVASAAKLARFDSLEALDEYLKATHPPQYPGHLDDEQYHAIARYLFVLNGRAAEAPEGEPTAETASPANTAMPSSTGSEAASAITPLYYYGAGLLVLILLTAGLRGWLRRKPDQ